jgi:hypothetical protein
MVRKAFRFLRKFFRQADCLQNFFVNGVALDQPPIPAEIRKHGMAELSRFLRKEIAPEF